MKQKTKNLSLYARMQVIYFFLVFVCFFLFVFLTTFLNASSPRHAVQTNCEILKYVPRYAYIEGYL